MLTVNTKEDFSFEGTPDNVADIIVDTLNTVRSQYCQQLGYK